MGIVTWLLGLSTAKLMMLLAAAAVVLIVGFITGKKLKKWILERWEKKHGGTVVIQGSVIKKILSQVNHGPNNLNVLDEDLYAVGCEDLDKDTDDDALNLEKLHSEEGLSEKLKNTLQQNEGVLIFDNTSG